MENNTRRAFKSRMDAKQDVWRAIPALMGDGSGTVAVPNQENMVYIRVGDGDLGQAFNNRCQLRDNLAIYVGYDPVTDPDRRIFQVLSVRMADYAGAGNVTVPNVGPHHATHEFGGGDDVYIDWRRLMGLRVGRPAAFVVTVDPGYIYRAGWIAISSTNVDLTATHAALVGTQAQYVLISLSGVGVVTATAGAVVLSPATLTIADVPTPPAGHIPLAAVRLYKVQTEIGDTPAAPDIIDLRFPTYDTTSAYVTPHNILSTSHGDSLAGAVVDGDTIIGNATPKWSRLAISIPAANVRNVFGVDNGELRPSWKTTLDATNPTTIGIGDAGGPGTSLIYSHRDHQHPSPATWTATAHDIFSAIHGDTTGAASPVDGDIIIANVTPKWSKLAISIPAANVRNVLGIDNGELRPSWKTALDGTAAADISGTAAAGTSLIFSHRDHVHRGVISVNKSGGATLYGAITLSEGANITLTQVGQDIAIAAGGGAGAHDILSATHTDTLADGVVDGDVIIGNVTPKWSRLAIAIPAANVRNVLGIDNGELRPSWKTALDATAPTTIAESAVAAAGTSLVFSHRDHTHGAPATWAATAHAIDGATHTVAGRTAGQVLIATAAATFGWSGFLLDGTAGGKTTFAVTNTKTLTLTATDDFNLTIPATGVAALLATANIFTANQTISSTAPSLIMTDTTALAKSLTIAVDANKADIRESAGAAGSLITLDLTLNRVGIGTDSPTAALHTLVADGVNGFRVAGATGKLTVIPYFDANTGCLFEAYDTAGISHIPLTLLGSVTLINSGLHVGGQSDPGDNNVLIDGYLTVSTAAGGNVAIGTGTATRLAVWSDANTLAAGTIVQPATNVLTITNSAASTLALAITSAKTLTLTATNDYNLTVPATGTAALLGTANIFTTIQSISQAATASTYIDDLVLISTGSVSSNSHGISWFDNTTWPAGAIVVNREGAASNFGMGFYTSTTATVSEKMHIYSTGGVVLGAPTGGDKGAGTLNAAADIYKNNSAYTNPDFALEQWVTGRIERFADKPGATDYRRMTLGEIEAYIKRNLRLPRMTDEPSGIFERADMVLEKLEELYTYVIEHEHRLNSIGA